MALYAGNRIDINHHIEFSPIVLVCNASEVIMDTDLYITFYGPTAQWDCPLKPPHVITNFTNGFTARVDQVCILYIIDATQQYHSGNYTCQVALQQNGSQATRPECRTLDSNNVTITIHKNEQPNNSMLINAIIGLSTGSIFLILFLFVIIIGLLVYIKKHNIKEKNKGLQGNINIIIEII